MQVFTDEDLDKAKAHFDRAGIAAAFVEVPHQGRTLHFADPAGTPVELCATMPTVPRMHTKIHTHRGAGALRMDHYQVLVPDVLTAARFYMDLGFRISDYLCVEGSEHVVGTFLHRKDNPWDIVLLTRSGRASTTAATWSRRWRTSSAPATSPAIWASATASSTAPAATATSIPIISTCAIRTGIAPSCSCPASRSSTSTTSRCAAWSARNPTRTCGGCRRRAAGSRRRPIFRVEIARPPVEGEPMTAEKYLAGRRPEAVVS